MIVKYDDHHSCFCSNTCSIHLFNKRFCIEKNNVQILGMIGFCFGQYDNIHTIIFF